MDYNLTAIYHKVREGYVGIVDEVPGANAQGETLEEVRDNLREAVDLIIDTNRALALNEISDSPL
jgi:predicted RNase H-like HicB family nuclease